MASPDAPACLQNCFLLSDCGPVRAENQDAGLVWRGEDGSRALIVADGMGGHAAGREAAEIVVRVCRDAFAARPVPAAWPQVLAAALASAHEAVLTAQQASGAGGRGAPGMGATVAIALLEKTGSGFRLQVAHAGDSRVYLLRGRSLYRLTDDHSLVARMVRDGWIGEEEAFGHPEANVIQRAVGQAGPFEPEIQEPAPLEGGDLVLVSSDGLHGCVGDEEIGRIAGGERDAEPICRQLLAAALERGSLDNITIGCCRLAASLPPRRPTRVPRMEKQ